MMLAGDPYPIGGEDFIDLLKLAGEQAIKGIVEANLVPTPFRGPLSHAWTEPPERR
jgi:hypothetical protein